MALFNVRNLMAIGAGLSASAAAVRNVLGKEVDKRADKLIDDAVAEARAEIKSRAKDFMSERFRLFMLTLLVKAVLILVVIVFYLTGTLPSGWSAFAFGALFIAFASYDTIRAFPTLNFLRKQISRFGMRPKLILSEMISVQVFEKTLERASGEPVDRKESVLMLLAGKKRDDVVERIARAVADISASTSWEDLRPFMLRFGVRFALLFTLYSSLVWGLFYFLSPI